MESLWLNLGASLSPAFAASTLLTPGGLLEWACGTMDAGVEQAAFALLGELASTAWPLIEPRAAPLLKLANDALIHGLRGPPRALKARELSLGNVLWCAGLMFSQLSAANAAAVVPVLLPGVLGMLAHKGGRTNIVVNAAVFACRMAVHCPGAVHGALLAVGRTAALPSGTGCGDLTSALALLENALGEMSVGVAGLCRLAQHAPADFAGPTLTKLLRFFAKVAEVMAREVADAAGDAAAAAAALAALPDMRTVVAGYKGALPAPAWAAALASLNGEARRLLHGALPDLVPAPVA